MATERLLLRELAPADAPWIRALNEDPEVLRYVHDAPFTDLAAAEAWIHDIPRALPRGIGRWAIVGADGTWIGRCSLRTQEHGEVLLGYRLLRTHWGQGYASEAVGLLLHTAFATHGLPYVLSKIARENRASIRVAEKNGGVFWKEEACGQFVDALVYRFDPPRKG